VSKEYYVYILTNDVNTTLYIGITNDLIRRIYEHKNDVIEGFTRRYRLHKLVYFESTSDVYEAITREKQLKGGSRQKKIDLVNLVNPNWIDLYNDLL
jgi:putative endonuclease